MEHAEHPYGFLLCEYQKLSDKSRVTKAGGWGPARRRRDTMMTLRTCHWSQVVLRDERVEKAVRPLAGPVSLIHTLSDGGNPKGCERGN